MSTRTEREKNKKQYDRHTSILMELLREDQNKYCADCRAKGPRWASWNLGIFVCITCAGIHRNLGVHISKVKSVNLDAWTAEQVKNVQEWGNKRAAEYYEFHLPDGFRRPHGDSSLEQFIRNKYEKKLYINKSGPPPARPTINSPEKVSQEKKKSSDNENKKISRPEPSKSVQNVAKTNNAPSNKAPSATADLLSLSEPVAPPSSQSQPPPPEQNSTLLSISATTTKQDNTADLLNFGGSSFQAPANNVQQPASQGFAFDLAQSMSTPAPVANTAPTSNGVVTSSNQTNLEDNLFKDDLSSGGQSKKDSIMALYQPSQKQANPQMFGVPGGVYLQQQQQQQQQQQMNVMAMNRPQGMTPQYNTQQQMFGAPQQQQQQQQQQMHQVNQVQQQMAMLGFGQQQQQPSTQAMPNNRATPNVQAGAGYNYNQPMPGMMQYNNDPAPYGNTPVVNGSWMPRPPGNFPQQQPTPQYVTTGPAAPRFNTYQAQGGVQSGHTLSTNLWK